MYIAKTITISLLLFLTSCSELATNISSNSCKVKRAAFDIGSGTTKMVVAEIDKCKNQIDAIIFEARRAIPFKENMLTHNNTFTFGFISEAISNIKELKSRAISLGVSEFKSVATSAFRKAKNSQEVLIRFKEEINLDVKIINQTKEALIAFHAAKSTVKKDPLLVWDVGGGSMQIIKTYDKRNKNIYLGKLASVTFKENVMSMLQKTKTPNPLGKKGAIMAMNLARDYASKKAKGIVGKIDKQYVVGVGGVHYYSIREQINTNEAFYNQKDLLNILLERSLLNDNQIGGKYAATDVTNIALVLGFMQALGIERVYPIKINMAHGILLD